MSSFTKHVTKLHRVYCVVPNFHPLPHTLKRRFFWLCSHWSCRPTSVPFLKAAVLRNKTLFFDSLPLFITSLIYDKRPVYALFFSCHKYFILIKATHTVRRRPSSGKILPLYGPNSPGGARAGLEQAQLSASSSSLTSHSSCRVISHNRTRPNRLFESSVTRLSRLSRLSPKRFDRETFACR